MCDLVDRLAAIYKMDYRNVPQHLSDLMGNPYGFYLVTQMNQVQSLINASNEEAIARALGKAIRHANRVVKREHIKGDRIERVNSFIVSLRTQLLSGIADNTISNKSAVVDALCKKEVWYDIGQPNPTQDLRYGKVSSAQIHGLLSLVKRFADETGAQADEILGDLEECERGIQGLGSFIEDAERINQEGGELLDELEAVFSDD